MINQPLIVKAFTLIISVLFCHMAVARMFESNTYGDKTIYGDKTGTPAATSSKGRLHSLRSFKTLDKYTQSASLVASDLLTPGSYEDTVITESIKKLRSRTAALFQEVEQAKRYVDHLDETSFLELPVGIKRTIGNLGYAILVDSITLKPDGAYLTVYMMFTLPSSGRSIAFRGSGIKFSRKGGIQPEDGRLELLGDYPIPFNDQTMLILKGGGATSVNFDCDGFQKMNLGAEILFSRDFIVPDQPGGNKGNRRVTASFETSLTDWNDFLVEVSIPNFQLTGVEGMSFNVSNVVFDYSDYRNAASVSFPENYLAKTGFDQNTETWRGFYMRNLTVRLPAHFNKRNSNQRTSFAASNVLIDKSGFSGFLEAENLINKEEGDLSGWAYSLSYLFLDFEASQLTSGGIEGELVIPITGESRSFDYTAIISNNDEYQFAVEMNDTLSFPMFKTSKVELFPNSSVEVVIKGGKFLPKANLYGTMDINTGDKGLSLADIRFENLQIQAEAPYLQADYFSFGSEAARQALSDFPVQVKNVGFRRVSDDEAGLDFDLVVNVTESFSGDASVLVTGKRVIGNRAKWKFHKFNVDEIGLDIKTGAFDIKGRLSFYKNDPVYGRGFNGQVEATIKSLNLTVESTAIFGNVDGFRYWYFDAGVKLPAGTTIVPGIDITGFAGGAYQRMGVDMRGGSELGQARSGLIYAPRENYGFGLKASISFASTGTGNGYNGEAGFEIAFFKGGGVRYISFKGNVFFMTAPIEEGLKEMLEKNKELGKLIAAIQKSGNGNFAENNENNPSLNQIYGQIGKSSGDRGSISARAFIELDFENNSLYGLFESHVNVAGGIIRGVGDGGRAGWVEFYFAPGEWHIYIGTPTDPMGVSIGIGPIRASSTSYFVMGTSIPGSPPPPGEVSEILGGIDLDYMSDLNALGNGAGIGFGSAFKFDTGNLTFLMFYASFKAGAGFDVMLKDYGNAKCVGRGKLGVNGWYANGQAYAYFDGKIGIKVNVFGRRKKFEILSIGAAAILQAKLPNPFWMRGTVGGRFSVMGGLVKGNCSFQVTLGEECKIQQEGSVLETIQVISGITPPDGSPDVSVFATPQAVFNLAVDREFEMIDYDEKRKRFRAKLDFFRIKDREQVVIGEIKLNADQNVAAFDSHEVLPPQKKLDAEIQVSFQEFRSGRWQPVIVEGKKYTEYLTTSFKSGEAPGHIPISNVKYSYPIINQLNFYTLEYFSGYIELKKGQDYLFNPGAEWEQRGRFVDVQSGQEKYFDFSYLPSRKEVVFNLPPGMNQDKIYTYELVNIPAKELGAIDRNVKIDSSRTIGDGKTKIVARKAEGAISQLQEKAIFETHIRTSKHTTFRGKIKALTISRTSREILFLWEGFYLNNIINNNELFSKEELVGNVFTHSRPMVQLSADLKGNRYFEQDINPLIYSDYPVGGAMITNRNPDSLGVVPVRAVKIYQSGTVPILEPLYIEQGKFNSTKQSSRIRYLLAPYMYFDFKDLQAQVARRYLSKEKVPNRIYKLIWGQFPIHSFGTYNIKASYYLPGKKIPSSEVIIQTVYE